MKIKKLIFSAVLLSSIAVLVACSSDDGSTSTTTVGGSVFAAPVDGASLTVSDTAGNVVAGPVVTTSGNYTINIPNNFLSSALIFESTGGTFTDEATGATTTAGAMAAYVSAGALSISATVHATPASTIIHHMVTQTTMSEAQATTAFQNAFGYIPDHTIAPTDATNPDANSDDAQKIAGLRAAVFSQLTLDLGLTAEQQFDLCVAIAQDLSDGELDGEDGTGPVMVAGSSLPKDIQNRFVIALLNFRAGNDNTGLDNAQIGNLPFATIALTDTYKLEYVPGMMEAMEGKTNFQLRITNRSDGMPATGLSVSLMPMMYMATYSHSTALEGITNEVDGLYDATVYYLMPSSMGDISMGYWDIKVMIGGMMGEVAHFYPDVMMAMGGNTLAKVKGQTDTIYNMMLDVDEPRTYIVFKESLTGTDGDHSFNVFLAAKESMMSFPAIDDGVDTTTILNAGTGDELPVASAAVEVSTDGSNWVSAVNNGSGHFSATGLSGMSSGVEAQIRVKVTINGEQKTSDGMTPDGGADLVTSNEFATFMITPK